MPEVCALTPQRHFMLIVEDHEPSREALGGHFARIGWLVAAAGTVAEGLRLLRDGPEPCCLVLDLDLPDGRGEQVMDAARAAGLRSRVVIATGNADVVRLAGVASRGPDALIPKPIAVEAVWDDVCRICGGEPGRSPGP